MGQRRSLRASAGANVTKGKPAADRHPADSTPASRWHRLQRARATGLESLATLSYGDTLLASDRQVDAVLEIDWIEGTPKPEFQAPTRVGVLTVVDIFREVGIDLRVQWSDELPIETMGSDGAFDLDELLATMEAHRDPDEADEWRFYVILAPRFAGNGVFTLMFDSEARRGAALFDQGGALADQSFALNTLVHEMGHLLNFPHPFQTYGDTKSVMTYSYRWEERSYDDPGVFRFDEFGTRHTLRGPERYVRSGSSAFLDYGAPVAWTR